MLKKPFSTVRIWAKYSCPNCDRLIAIENLEGSVLPSFCPFCKNELNDPSRFVLKNCFVKEV